MREAGQWQKEALCRDENPDDFFTGQGQNPTHARTVCPRCPVRDECLNYAIMYGEKGFWGGLTDKERSKLPLVSQVRSQLIREAKSQGLYENRPSIESLIEEARRAGVFEFSRREVLLEKLEPPAELSSEEPVPTFDDRDQDEDYSQSQYPATA